ncbi:MAG: alpha-amylase family glycosyl hydrolase [Bacteroidales bacterium]|nr:alpha-amylase family glycosyl hydrolase [Bacteroidales bacterium]MDZ4203653.1 alpha-amylase family glycosyl hydrolase [Bacteroidales bacterium]
MKTNKVLIAIWIIFALLFAGSISAQVITTNPLFPTDAGVVVITFDATKGSGALAGYTGDVYAHTGVKVQGNTSWQYVIGSWGNNTIQPRLTRIATNIYQLTITPGIRQFYNVPADKVIVQMAFVFRASTNSPQTEDLFVDVYAPGLNIMITSPANNSIYLQGDQFAVNAASNQADSMFLYYNSQVLAAVAGNQLNYQFTTTAYGNQKLYITAKNQVQTRTDSISFFVRGAVPIAVLPSGAKNGINYINQTTVTLVLHDPPALKQFVFLIGDFNNWAIGEMYYMNRTPDGKHYWITLDNLVPGTEYIYQYLIDGQLRLADPYCEKVSDPWNDQYIPATNYPGLISYPAGRTSGVASVLQTAQTPYNWEIGTFTAPAVTDLVIYELHIRDFVATRAIKTMIDTLNYLQKLGVNAIELMPINEFEGNDSWGYNTSFYFATDKAYGRKQDYQRFIDECHKRGIAVIVDMVLNHSYGLSPMVQMYFNPNAGQWGQPTAQNPWYSQICPHEPFCWGYDFNHQSLYTQEFIDRVNAFWLTEFKVDGFRFDFTKGFTNFQTGNTGSNYDLVRINLLKRMADKIKVVKPNAYIILEHFAENSEEKELAEYGMMLWGNMNGAYRDAIRASNPSSNFNGISYMQRNWNVPHLVGYMESHDEERQMYYNLSSGNTSNAAHDIKDLTIALKRMELAAAFFHTIPGPKMIWQFGELGYDYSIDYNGRLGAKPVRWDYYSDYRRKYLYNMSSALIKLKTSRDAFRTSDFSLSLSTPSKRIKLTHTSMNVVILGNFAVQIGNITPEFHHTGWWYNYFLGDSINVTDINAAILLMPGEYRIYTNKRLPKPDIATGIFEPGELNKPAAMMVLRSNDGLSHHVIVHLAKPENLQLELLDLAGRRASTIAEGRYSYGTHEFQFDSSSRLDPGVYLVRLYTASWSQTEKVMVF